jgi:hypothetical protein
MALVLQGRRLEVPGLATVCDLDEPKRCPRTRRVTPRAEQIRCVMLHTVHGKLGQLADGLGPVPDTKGAVYARAAVSGGRGVSWDFTVGRDGVVWQHNDPADGYTWHGNQLNRYSIGIELVQDADGTLYAAQLAAAVLLVDVLTREFGIQRQIPWRDGAPIAGVIPRLVDGLGDRPAGYDVVGVIGHRNVTRNRGPGDPGDHVFRALYAAGYEGRDLVAGEDLAVWAARQRDAGAGSDGLPLRLTRQALERAGCAHGQWVPRPIDAVALVAA